ncbi:hypothetical protein [Flavobacterium adhaerens]|uniref:hypothetical protein n=1 Tax=Flavobacterium adhaerens TaxID=3149043 RepID=UPI0032B5C357
MCNCNQKRSAFTNMSNQNPIGMVRVKLVKNEAVVLNGNITGRTYIFRTINDVNWVDKRDALSITAYQGLQLI